MKIYTKVLYKGGSYRLLRILSKDIKNSIRMFGTLKSIELYSLEIIPTRKSEWADFWSYAPLSFLEWNNLIAYDLPFFRAPITKTRRIYKASKVSSWFGYFFLIFISAICVGYGIWFCIRRSEFSWDCLGKLWKFKTKYYVSGLVLLIYLRNIYLSFK